MPVVLTDDIQICSAYAYVLYEMSKESDPDDVLYARIDFVMGHFDTWQVKDYIDIEAQKGITDKGGPASVPLISPCYGMSFMKYTAKGEDGHMETVRAWGTFMPRNVPKRVYMNDDLRDTQVTAPVDYMNPYEYAVARYQLIGPDDKNNFG